MLTFSPTFRSRPKSSSASDHAYQQQPTTSAAASAAQSSESSSAEDDVQEVKYRRMRDLNNIASKRCRQNRKRKFEALLGEEDALRKRNAELRIRCKHMEELVSDLKRKFIERVSNPNAASKLKKKREPLDLDQLMTQHLSGVD